MLTYQHPLSIGLTTQILWSSEMLEPLERQYGGNGNTPAQGISKAQAEQAWNELVAASSELRTMVYRYASRTGALPVVGDELYISTVCNYMPTEFRVERRILYFPDESSEELEVIYYITCDIHNYAKHRFHKTNRR